MSLDYDAMQAAIKSAVVAGTGLRADNVLWAYQKFQGGARPANERHITMLIGPSAPLGIDGYTTFYDDSRAVGEEVELRTISIREFGVLIQCFGGTPAGNGSALATLQRFRDRLALPSVRDYLTAAGVSPFSPGTVNYVPGVEGTKFEGRATLEMRCYVNASESDYAGYIAKVSGSYEYTDAGTFVVLEGTFSEELEE
jgi:hypothetical protein